MNSLLTSVLKSVLQSAKEHQVKIERATSLAKRQGEVDAASALEHDIGMQNKFNIDTLEQLLEGKTIFPEKSGLDLWLESDAAKTYAGKHILWHSTMGVVEFADTGDELMEKLDQNTNNPSYCITRVPNSDDPVCIGGAAFMIREPLNDPNSDEPV